MTSQCAVLAHSSPLVIGVSGHRDLHPDGVPQVKRRIDEFLADLKRRLPDTELRIMTGMVQEIGRAHV